METRTRVRAGATRRPISPAQTRRILFSQPCSPSPPRFDTAISRSPSTIRLTPLVNPPDPLGPSTKQPEWSPLPDPKELERVARVSRGKAHLYLAMNTLHRLPQPHRQTARQHFLKDERNPSSGDQYWRESVLPIILRLELAQSGPVDIANCGWGQEGKVEDKKGNYRKGQRDGSREDKRASNLEIEVVAEEKWRSGLCKNGIGLMGRKKEVENRDTVHRQHKVEGLEARLRELSGACTQLYKALVQGGYCGPNCPDLQRLLGLLLPLLNQHSAQLSLLAAQLLLALKINGNDLVYVCKLVFEMASEKSNDWLFKSTGITNEILAFLKEANFLAQQNALLYCIASIKLMAGPIGLGLDLLCQGVLQRLLGVLAVLCPSETPVEDISVISKQLLVQVTAALRNLADHHQSRLLFESRSALPLLCSVLRQFICDGDISTNIIRIFSKLSAHEDSCKQLADHVSCASSCLSVLQKNLHKQGLVLRLCYLLGNLAGMSEVACKALCPEGVETLLDVLQCYSLHGGLNLLAQDLASKSSYTPTHVQLDSSQRSQKLRPHLGKKSDDMTQKREVGQVDCEEDEEVMEEEGEEKQIAIDVLVKCVRVFVNLSAWEAEGSVLARHKGCVRRLIQMLECMMKMRIIRENQEELLLNLLTAFNNLSFPNLASLSPFQEKEILISRLLLKLLENAGMEVMLEILRTFGNLSRSQPVRTLLLKSNVHSLLLDLMDTGNSDICYLACGILLNLSSDLDAQPMLETHRLINRLVVCLVKTGATNDQLAFLVCQTLWNSRERGLCALTQPEQQLLITILTKLQQPNREHGDDHDTPSECGAPRVDWNENLVVLAKKLLVSTQEAEQV
uniref:armadillo repeat-containing protein 2 n=1 Tax=Myxine glutinosa TaxID=7769 RepID=UPI00358FFF39